MREKMHLKVKNNKNKELKCTRNLKILEDKEKGITLIALVITIIVLLILAGVSIATLTGENGIITRATESKEQNKTGEEKEAIGIAYNGVMTETKGEGVTAEKLEQELRNNGHTKARAEDNGDGTITVTFESGNSYTIDANGEIIGPEKGTTGGVWNGKVNTPRLAEGMIPIKWDENKNNWVICAKTDEEWYNYVDQISGEDGESKWANVMLSDGKYYAENSSNVDKEGKEEAREGIEVEKEELGSMFVWIPRYAYQIESGYHANTAGKIKISFLEGTKKYSVGDTIRYTSQGTEGTGELTNASGEGNWNEHPAFNYGGTTVTGIWVAKFEASSSNPSASSGGGDTTDLKVKVLPGVTSWRGITIGKSYENSVNMNSEENGSYYGISESDDVIDPHLMKNNEWGAVAYLTQSSYGRNGKEITINNSSSYITGSAGNSVSAGGNVGTTNDYTNSQGVLASTTGNVYGIYDMSGGAWERVAGYVNNGNSSLTYGKELIESNIERHKQVYNAYNTSGEIITTGTDSQQKNYENMSGIYGDAVYETSSSYSGATSWYGDYSGCPCSSSPFFRRGGSFNGGSSAGAFYFSYSNGFADSGYSFRPSVVAF